MIELTAQDRCDRCGARAMSRATRSGMPSDLLFCGHHTEKYRDALIDNYWLIETDMSPSGPVPAAAYTS